jgi:hypothetical protein
MSQETITPIHDATLARTGESLRCAREAGVQLGRSHQFTKPRGHTKVAAPSRRRLKDLIVRASTSSQAEAAWVLDNFRLIFGAEREARALASRLKQYPVVMQKRGGETPRLCLLARSYLLTVANRFSEQTLIEFMDGYQDAAPVRMSEIWNLSAALQLELIGLLTDAPPEDWPVLLTSMRKISDLQWKDVFEACSQTHRLLTCDPAAAYQRMDFESKELYRKALSNLAKHCTLTEPEIAATAIDLAENALRDSDGSRAAIRRAHVGYYLIDQGRAQLEACIGYRPSLPDSLRRFVLRHPTGFYLSGIEVLTLLIVFLILYKLDSVSPSYCGLLLLILPATQAATDFLNSLIALLIPPRVLAKLDFSAGIPHSCATMVAVPALLLNEGQVHDLALDLEIRFLANPDPNLYFALLTDCPDCNLPEDHHDALVDLCRGLIAGLNQRYGRDSRRPFFLFHRRRTFNESEGVWMGWERKRGKLLDLNRLLRNDGDAFPVKEGDLSVLPEIRFVITLDSDTQLPRDSAARLVGAIAHPLSQAVIDPARRKVVEGYGILQPRIGISVQSAARSRLASLYSGQTGFDIYTRAISNVYQDLFGEGIFTGKAIYEVDALRSVLEGRFPENSLLSHDLIEGAYARVGLVNDIELIDDYPSHFSAYSRRKHRWMRGDWQILRWIQARVPDYYGRWIPNPISLISQWKILDNLRRSLLEPALVLLLLSGWLWLPGRPEYWTSATILIWSLPVFSGLFFALPRAPRSRRAWPGWLAESARSVRDHALITMCSLIFLLHQALISADAIVRAVSRAFVTRKKMLEWESAAEAEAAACRTATVDVYLKWTPWIALAIGAMIWRVRPESLASAAPLLGLWTASHLFSIYLNRRPRAGHNKLNQEQSQLLRDSADRIWRFFHDWSSPATNWLVPDSVREDGAIEPKLSPTNLGMLLNSRIAAVHLGVMPLAEFVFQTRQTLDCVARLSKYKGHLLNWYDINTLEPISPFFVSTVDSGNLAASLWTLKQAAQCFASESAVKRGLTSDLAVELRTIAEICHRLVDEMDFQFLYQPGRQSLSIGFDTSSNRLELASYDLLASEARTAAFIAIAKGDVPQDVWIRLGRAHTTCRGEGILLSWTGTMFEYLMPALWMRHYPETLLDHTTRAAVRAQRDYGRRRGVPWGISESACLCDSSSEYGYAPFGLPELALKRAEAHSLVISPYSSFLAAAVDPSTAVENLRQMREFGWLGRYGFYEAIQYTADGGEPVRMWMAHHQGMSLLAVANLLCDNPLQRYFHAEPQVMATELLLHERVPSAALAEADTVPAMKELGLAAA